MSQILSAENIYKSYKLGQSTLSVLHGVNFSVSAGEFVAIIGASGSGKSTLLHILGALDSPDKGYVEFEGQRLDRFGAAKTNRFRNKMVGFVFQFYHLLDELNVLENAVLPAMASMGTLSWITARKRVKKRAAEFLDRVGLGERLGQKSYQLSGGERQRVAIVRALINQPKVLLADEPTGNLDYETGIGILEVLEELNRQGQTIVMVTHDDRVAARAHRMVRLEDGKIVDCR